MLKPMLAPATIGLFAGVATATLPNYSLESAAIPGQNGLPFDIAITNESPSINDTRDIAVAFLDSSNNDGVYVTRGGPGQVVRLTPGVVGDVEINEFQDVVWSEFFSSPDGVYASTAPSATSSLATNGPLGASSFSAPDIDNFGRIYYRAGFGGFAQAYVGFDTGTNTFTTFATSTDADATSPFSFLYTPSSNDNAQIAGKVDTGAAGAGIEEVRVFNADGSSVTIASSSFADPFSPFGTFDNSVGLNDSGEVVFVSRGIAAGGGTEDGVFVSDGDAPLKTIATTLDPQLSSIQFFAPVLSNAGIAAFIGEDAAGEEAIFAGDGVDLVRVLGSGDAVETPFGTKFVAPDSLGGNIGINAQGDIVFNVFLLNGDGSGFGRVIGIAAIPAPGSAVLLGGSCVLAVRRRR